LGERYFVRNLRSCRKPTKEEESVMGWIFLRLGKRGNLRKVGIAEMKFVTGGKGQKGGKAT